MLVLIVLTISGVILFNVDGRDEETRAASQPAQQRPAAAHTLGDAEQASIISIFLSEEDGASYMAGSGTPEFEALAGGIARARPVAGETDESFTDLLVVSFGRGETLEASYSPARNLLIFEGRAYQPDTNLSLLVSAVKSRTDS